jgi:solute carrier family 15 (peptide/histidine transporter), member 3/4
LHLDYFYWLLTGLCAVELLAFLFFSRAYAYKRKAGDGGASDYNYRGGDDQDTVV